MAIEANDAVDARSQLRAAGKDERLAILGDSPLVAETPASLLGPEITPTAAFYVRNNGVLPAHGDPTTWRLTIDGEVGQPLHLSLADLRSMGEVTRRMVLECAGNGRSAFSPPAAGNPWTHGGVGCATWTGLPLAAVLERARPLASALHTAHF